MKLLSIVSELQTCWANRRDPRASRALAEMLWRTFLVLGAIVVVASWIFAATLVFVPQDDSSQVQSARPSVTLDKKRLSDILRVFTERQARADALRAELPSIVDPAKSSAKTDTKSVTTKSG